MTMMHYIILLIEANVSNHIFLELLAYEDSNVIGVDWGELASWTNYFAAAENALDVGTHVGHFIIKVIDWIHGKKSGLYA